MKMDKVMSIMLPVAFAAIVSAACRNQPMKASEHETEKMLSEAAKDDNTQEEAVKSNLDVRITNKGDSVRIVSLLKEGRTLGKEVNDVLFFARKFMGKPYVAYTLDQELNERLVINTEGLDCTTYVENVMALAISARRHLTTFEDFCQVLSHVRYVDGKVAYTKRQHYFTYWISDNINESLISEIELPPAPLSQQRKPKVDYMTTHVASYKMLNAHQEWLPEIKKMEEKVNATTFTFIPKAQLKDSGKYRKYIKDGDIIGIVTNKAGLDISHVGFAVWHNGQLHLMNASSLHKKVVDETMTLYQYLQKQTSSAGIRVVRIN